MSKRIIRVLSMVLTLVMFLSVSTPAFAWGGGDIGNGWDRQIGEDDFREFTPAEEVEEEEVYDYFQTSGEGGYQVTVEAPMGSLPMQAELRAEPVEIEEIREAVESVVEGEANILVALDISFWMNGIEIEPEDAVRVKISAPELVGKTNLSVVHIPDGDEPEKVNLVDEEGLSFALGTNEIAFEANSFSVYVVTGDEIETPIITYNFVDGNGDPYPFLNTAGQTVTSQKIKDGEALQEVPAPGLIGDNAFNGWYYYENGTYGEAVVFGEPITVTETKEVTIRAHYGSVIYVTFYQYAKGEVVLERKQIPQSEDGKYYCDMGSVSVPAPSTTLKFMGWSLTPGTDASETEGDAPGSRGNIMFDETVTFDQNTDVYPVYYTGIWVVFVSAGTGMGADYVESYFLPADSANASAAEPSDPAMKGYAFDHWSLTPDTNYETADTADAFDFNTSFDNLKTMLNDRQELVLYGHWKGGNTTYIIVFWKQNVNDDKNATTKKYDYFKQEGPRTGQTGTNPGTSYTAPTADTGFQYVSTKLTDADGNEISGLAADGSSILNVYYDRRLITLKFDNAYVYTATTGNTGTQYGVVDGKYQQIYYRNNAWRTSNSNYGTVYQGTRYTRSTEDLTYTGLYGQTLAQNGYTWPSSNPWLYRSNGQTSGGNQYAMSYLGQFVLPVNRIPNGNVTVTTVNFYTNNDDANTIYYYIQNGDGTWPTTPTGSGITTAGEIQIPEKYDGFTADAYEYNNGGRGGNYTANNATWRDAKDSSGTAYTVDVENGMAIRYRRNVYTLKYVNPIDESEVLDSVGVRYGSVLTNYKPGSDVEIDLGVPGYEWDGKWYKDKSCTVEFDFTKETMPLGDTKVYAGKTALYYFVKIDPNGGQLQTGQATWRWVTYGDDTTYTYDNIERNYSEYKGEGDAYYYYYDEFEVDRREDIWNYVYMSINPRTAYYTKNTVPNDWIQTFSDGTTVLHQGSEAQDWLDTTTQYTYEKDAYQLIGWYKLNDDGSMTPFKTGTAITEDTVIQAQWRRTGKYTVSYEEAAVDEDGNALVDDEGNAIKTLTKISDTSAYADQSDAAIGDLVVPPAGYNFVGWLYDGDIYSPGDIYVIQAKLSDENSVIHIYPVLEPVETLPVEVIDITFDPNGGKLTDSASTEVDAIIAALTQGEDGDATYTPEKVLNDDGTITIKNLKVNESFKVLSAATAVNGIEVDGAMVPGLGYRLKEWNTKPDGSGTSFGLDYIVGVDLEAPLPNTLYAIWEELFYVYHSGVEGGNIETLVVDGEPFDLTNTPEGLTEGTLYGGYYLEKGFNAAAASSDDGETGELDDGEGGSSISTAPSYAAYDGTNWTWTTPVRTEAGNAITPVAGTTYYIKEVPADKYLQPYLHYTYKLATGELTAAWLISDIDDAKYKEVGFLVISSNQDKAKACRQLTVQNTNEDKTTTVLTPTTVFAKNGCQGGYLTYLAVRDANGPIASTGFAANCTIKQYWVTPDGLAVTSANARTYKTIGNHNTIDGNAVDLTVETDGTVAESHIYGKDAWAAIPSC